MNKRLFLILPYSILAFILLFNFITFYYFRCGAEYLESKNYLGITQSVSRTSLNAQKSILAGLPEDRDAALEAVNDFVYLKTKYMSKESQEKMEKYSFPVTYELNDYIEVGDILVRDKAYLGMRKSIYESSQSLAQISIFKKAGYQEELAATTKAFYGLANIDIPIAFDNGINIWINNKITDLLVVVLALFFSVFFSLYHKEQSKNIHHKVHILSIGAIVAAVSTAFMYVGNFALVYRFVDAYDLSTLVQSFASFHYYPRPMQLWVFILIFVFVKMVMAVLVYGLMVAIMHTTNREKILPLVIIGILIAGSFVIMNIPGQNRLITFLKEINILSFVNFERFYFRYYNLNVFNLILPRLSVFIVFTGAISLFVLFWSSFKVSGYVQKEADRAQYSYYEEINEKYTQMRHLWHDFHNHLLAIQELTRREEYDAANTYIKELEEEIDKTHLLARTGSNALDVLLYQKSELAKEKGLELDIRINAGIDTDKYKELDICCIVGNLLDNCIEALSKYVKKDGEDDSVTISRKAVLEISKKGEMLYIRSDNQYSGEIKRDAKGIKTSKSDAPSHGFGLSGVRRVCERYNGSLMIDTKDGHFTVCALLMAEK